MGKRASELPDVLAKVQAKVPVSRARAQDERFSEDAGRSHAQELAAEGGGEALALDDGALSQSAGEVLCSECGEEAGGEGRVARGVGAPQRVTTAMREEHENTHTRYRFWCEFCVKARDMNKAHRRLKKYDAVGKDVGQVPRISMD